MSMLLKNTSELVCLSTCDNEVPLEVSDMIEILALRARTLRSNTTYYHPTLPLPVKEHVLVAAVVIWVTRTDFFLLHLSIQLMTVRE